MRYEHHTWKIGKNPPIIRPHSLAKHRVLEAYLSKYISVVGANLKIDRLRLSLVDGFAGGGKYIHFETKNERIGSPFIMLDTMKAAQQNAQDLRSKPFNLDVDYFFVEKDHDAFEYLKKGNSQF